MALSNNQDGVTKLALSDKEERKNLWEIWKTKHPESKKTWRTDRTQRSDTLRCQATVIVKKITATILEQTDSESEETEEPASLERTDSIQSEISDIDIQVSPADARRIQEEVQDMREETENSFTLDPILSSPIEGPRETEISEIYIDEEIQTKWSKNNIMAYTFQTEPFPVKAPSETNRYDLKRFYEYIPEELLKSNKEEHKFLEENRINYPQLNIENLHVEWITFLCHEELATQGDTDDHMWFSHGLEMSELKDEKRIQKNKITNLILKEATDVKTLSEKSLDKLMESWYESAVANNILFTDMGRLKDKIRSEKSVPLVTAISKAIGPTLTETFKINLGNKLEGTQSVNKGFSCKWIKIEKAIQNSLGQSPNMERLSKCMETKDWGETSLQQALHNISNFHETNLDSKKMIYKNKMGELKDFEMNKKSMKIMSAVTLIKNLPSEFDEIKYELQTDMSDAFFDPEIKYENVIEETEKKIKKRGHTMLYSETKITNKRNNTDKAQKQVTKEPHTKEQSNTQGRKEILNYIKTNKHLKGPITKNRKLNKIIRTLNL